MHRAASAASIHPGVAPIPEALRRSALKVVLGHEADWGFGDEDGEGIMVCGCLSGWRGGVGTHTDRDFASDVRIGGLILYAEGSHWLEVEGQEPLPLAEGTVYYLDPYVPHGTRQLDRDDGLIVFAIRALHEYGTDKDLLDPAALAASLIAEAEADLDLHLGIKLDDVALEAFRYRGIAPYYETPAPAPGALAAINPDTSCSSA